MSTLSARAPLSRSAVWRWLAGGLAIAFGLATVLEGGHVLFGGPDARASAGNVVPFVLMFNFGAGFLYVIAGVLILLARRASAVAVARLLAVSTLLVFGAFAVHVFRGDAFELRTVVAMAIRSAFWGVLAVVLPSSPAASAQVRQEVR